MRRNFRLFIEPLVSTYGCASKIGHSFLHCGRGTKRQQDPVSPNNDEKRTRRNQAPNVVTVSVLFLAGVIACQLSGRVIASRIAAPKAACVVSGASYANHSRNEASNSLFHTYASRPLRDAYGPAVVSPTRSRQTSQALVRGSSVDNTTSRC